jgi:hypothetical protein
MWPSAHQVQRIKATAVRIGSAVVIRAIPIDRAAIQIKTSFIADQFRLILNRFTHGVDF